MYRLQFFAICILAFNSLGDTSAISFIQPCKPNDAACHKASAIAAFPHFAAGLPELGVPPAEPVILNDIRSDQKDLKLGFRNMKITEMSKCTVIDFVRNVDKSTMQLIVECPIKATGQYDLDGKIFVVQAEGNGDFDLTTDKVKLDITVKLKVVEIKGEKHWKITGFDYNYDIIEKATVNFHNLFGGDEKRAKPIRDVLEKSSNELVREFGGPIIKELLTILSDIVQKFFNAVPISALEIS